MCVCVCVCVCVVRVKDIGIRDYLLHIYDNILFLYVIFAANGLVSLILIVRYS